MLRSFTAFAVATTQLSFRRSVWREELTEQRRNEAGYRTVELKVLAMRTEENLRRSKGGVALAVVLAPSAAGSSWRGLAFLWLLASSWPVRWLVGWLVVHPSSLFLRHATASAFLASAMKESHDLCLQFVLFAFKLKVIFQ